MEPIYNFYYLEGMIPEYTVRVVLQLSPHFQNIYNSETLSLVYFLADDGLYYGEDHSIYACDFVDLFRIANENNYLLMKLPKLKNAVEYSGFFKALIRNQYSVIPLNDTYALVLSANNKFVSEFRGEEIAYVVDYVSKLEEILR